MNNHITHDGVVSKIDGQYVTVRFVQQSACAGCHAKMLCTSGDMKQRSIVANSFGVSYSVGELVSVEVTSQLAWTAMFYAFGLPALIALLVLFPVNAWLGEMIACGASLGSLALYYILFCQFRNRLERKVVFILHRKFN